MNASDQALWLLSLGAPRIPDVVQKRGTGAAQAVQEDARNANPGRSLRHVDDAWQNPGLWVERQVAAGAGNRVLSLSDVRDGAFHAFLWDMPPGPMPTMARIAEAFVRMHSYVTARYDIDMVGRKDRAQQTDSLHAPLLHTGTLTLLAAPAMRQLIDNNDRIVLKQYTLPHLRALTAWLDAGAPAPVPPDLTKALATARDVVLDVAINVLFLNTLVTDYAHVVTPHFAYMLDWFIAPKFRDLPADKADGIVPALWRLLGWSENAAYALPDEAVQCTVVERADVTLKALVQEGNLAQLQTLPAIFAQVLFSLHAAWLYGGFVHQDLHAGNVMVRDLNDATRDADNPYRHETWFYEDRRTAPLRFLLTPADHGNHFVEIIDFDSSRVALPSSGVVLTADTVKDEVRMAAATGNRRPALDVAMLAADLLVVYLPAANVSAVDALLASGAFCRALATMAMLPLLEGSSKHLLFMKREPADVHGRVKKLVEQLRSITIATRNAIIGDYKDAVLQNATFLANMRDSALDVVSAAMPDALLRDQALFEPFRAQARDPSVPSLRVGTIAAPLQKRSRESTDDAEDDERPARRSKYDTVLAFARALGAAQHALVQ
jgi:hypothetical protein